MPSTPNTDLSFYIHKLSNHTDRISHAIYDRRALSDCSLTSLFVLDFLYEHPDQPICQRDIEDEFFINRATASKMLRLMEDKQLIRRTVSGQDRRLKTIELLDKGREIAEKIYERHTLLSGWLTGMGVSPEVAAEDACRIEHVISNETFDALKRHVRVMSEALKNAK